MQDKPVALVTGANKGIGLQIANDLAAHGFTVLVGSCNLEHGEAAARSIGADACALQLDVDESGLCHCRGGAHSERVRPSRRAREQRGHLACGQSRKVV